jgi:hypothetical protein
VFSGLSELQKNKFDSGLTIPKKKRKINKTTVSADPQPILASIIQPKSLVNCVNYRVVIANNVCMKRLLEERKK